MKNKDFYLLDFAELLKGDNGIFTLSNTPKPTTIRINLIEVNKPINSLFSFFHLTDDGEGNLLGFGIIENAINYSNRTIDLSSLKRYYLPHEIVVYYIKEDKQCNQ